MKDDAGEEDSENEHDPVGQPDLDGIPFDDAPASAHIVPHVAPAAAVAPMQAGAEDASASAHIVPLVAPAAAAAPWVAGTEKWGPFQNTQCKLNPHLNF